MKANIIHATVLCLAFSGCISIIHLMHELIVLPHVLHYLVDAVVSCLLLIPMVIQYSSWSEMVTLAKYDALTGLFNRSSFNKEFKKFIKRGDKFQLVLIDLCKFKYINDTYGHRVGDDVLKIIAERMQDSLRKGDISARLGGDEFVILVKGELSDVEYINLIKSVELPMEISGTNLSVGLSVGVTTYPIHGEDYTSLMYHADCAMYYAKKSGIDLYHGIPPEVINR